VIERLERILAGPELVPISDEIRFFGEDVQNLQMRIWDELTARKAFVLSLAGAKLFESKEPLFGVEVFNAFPSASDDIAEAGKCLALERGTACVMHLQRASEVGLKVLARTLGISNKNDWGSYIREIETALAALAKASRARSPDEIFYAEAVASFDYLKRAYRNPSMHPDRSYSLERAREIYDATCSFMRHLSARISEAIVP
jgi:hypothetical protein